MNAGIEHSKASPLSDKIVFSQVIDNQLDVSDFDEFCSDLDCLIMFLGFDPIRFRVVSMLFDSISSFNLVLLMNLKA
ncbi:hypothetical protein HanXRQr2_Chr11g0514701 [Helianthus annuus]|uniref:Uncharacterized protein n=1 Tax=Helianthus annuus TaxID=4232 RepID=A0A9K3HTE2_HELAN|nr:hypothetical protein HanXRQr2_Chr11g0514701 [Helianthus annuus]KAJ0877082.1 hypothetical protein HanPSC8_Chr11g0496031 [Helianthus annuus]